MADLKQKQKFEQNWNRFKTVTGEQNPAQKPKIEITKVPSIFQKVVAERNKKAEEAFEVKLLGLIEAKEQLDKDLKKGKDDLAKREEVEYEKLNKAFENAYQDLVNVQQQGQNLMNQASGNFAKEEGEDNSTSTEAGEDKA